MGKNCIQGLSDSGSLFPASLQGKGFDMSNPATESEEFSIDINLEDVKGIFLEGDDGCAPSVDGIGTLYYSGSLLKIMSSKDSSITLGGNKIKITEGSMWYDHQWGTGFMPSGAPKNGVMRAMQNLSTPAPGGWDWFMFQFHDDASICPEGEVQLCLSALHTKDNEKFYFQTGPEKPGTMTAACSGKYIGAYSPTPDITYPVVNTTDVTGTLTVTDWVQVNSSPNPAVYPPTNTWYPAKYEFTLDGDIPNAIKKLIATPLIASGQTGYFGTGLQYTEGGTIITTQDAPTVEIGRGFAEGTNWANCNEGICDLAELPGHTELLKAPEASWAMKLLSCVDVVAQYTELEKILASAKGLSSSQKKKHEQAIIEAKKMHAEKKSEKA